jgi:hypothetical protein
LKLPSLPASLTRLKEGDMRRGLFVIALAALALTAADAASARARHHRVRAHCADRPNQFSWGFLLPGQRAPHPNGCAPPVYAYGKYVGQDPDPNIRHQLMRDPTTGYSVFNNP